MSEQTIRDAYEALILEHASLQTNHKALLKQVGQALAVLMGRNKTRVFSADRWAGAAGKTIRLTPLEDGSIQLTVEVPE